MNAITWLDASNLFRVKQWGAEQERVGMGGGNGSCQQQRREAAGEALVLSCLMYLRAPFSFFDEGAAQKLSCAFFDCRAMISLQSA